MSDERHATPPDEAQSPNDFLGLAFEVEQPDRVVATMPLQPGMRNRRGAAHGAMLMAFADLVGIRGTILNLPPGYRSTTIESKTNFVRGGRGDVMRAEASAIHKGRRTQVWVTRITDEQGELVSVTTQTQLVLEA